MASLFNYIPEEVNVLLAGFIPLDGFVDGTFIEITKDKVPYSTTTTTDGITSRLYNNDQTFTIKITLHNGSTGNDLLDKLQKLDELTQLGKFPLLIKDSSGTDIFFSTTTWIEQPPNMSKSNTVDGRVWGLRSSQGIINIGSNSEASSLLEDITNLAIGTLPILAGSV